MQLKKAISTLFITTVFLAACGGGHGTLSGLPPVPDAPAAPRSLASSATTRVRFTVEGIRTDTRSMSVSLASAAGESRRIDLDLTPARNRKCVQGKFATTCSLAFDLPEGTYDAAFATFGGPLGANARPTGRILSQDQHLPIVAEAGSVKPIGVTLSAVLASVGVYAAAGSGFGGTAASGLKLSKCAKAQSLSVVALDAKGNAILGPGSPTVSLAPKSNPIFKIVKQKSGVPNAFTLTPAFIPAAHAVAGLTATARPASSSSGTKKHLDFSVAFNGDICGVLTEYPLTALSGPFSITTGKDGNLWFTELGANKIGRIATDGTGYKEFGGLTNVANNANDIVAGPDGALWFTETAASKIGRITTSGSLQEYPTKTASAQPYGMTAGPDGKLWFVELTANAVAKITTSGTVTEYTSGISANAQPAAITVGPDKALWFTEDGPNKVGRITTDGSTVNEFDVAGGNGLFDIVLGSDGNFWFTEILGEGSIDEMAPSFSPTTIRHPTADFNSTPLFLAAGPDGAIWYAEGQGNAIVRASSTQPFTQTRYPVPVASSGPNGITVGPDGSLWFTEVLVSKIGRLQ